MIFENQSSTPMNDFAIQFNVNTYGIGPNGPLVVPNLAPGEKSKITLALNLHNGRQQMDPPNLIQIALKNNIGVYYFQTLLPVGLLA